MYYENKLETLKSIFGSEELDLQPDALTVGESRYPIIDDVIILSPPEEQTEFVRRALQTEHRPVAHSRKGFAEDIQFTFGAEWSQYSWLGPEVEAAMKQYRDIINVDQHLKNKRLCDLGCGAGRASYYVKDLCREIILVDFSDAIFAARKNLAGADNCLFFMCNLKTLPFTERFADCLFCLGVLHHLPTPCLDEVRRLKGYAPTLLIYLYYALDNRPLHYRVILRLVDLVRVSLSRVRSRAFRRVFSFAGAVLVYKPLVLLGGLLRPLGLSSHVPLYDGYRGVSIRKMTQNAYDRFFTRIEQRVARADILRLEDTFDRVTVSDNIPYWHFLCETNRQ